MIDKCVECGRSATQASLNFEAQIHHGRALKCIDRKPCERLKRVKARRKSRDVKNRTIARRHRRQRN